MSIIRDGIIGFAIGDAMGVPVEYEEREELIKNPITSMKGYGTHDVPEGTWSDDTSFVLATMDSIIKCGDISYNDIADKYCNWIRNGDYTATGKIFDIDITSKNALLKYASSKDVSTCGQNGIKDNGNGSLSRMIPVAYYCFYNHLRSSEVYELVRGVSSITHSSSESILGCFIFVNYLLFILNGKDKYASYNMIKFLDYKEFFDEDTIEFYNRLLKTNINNLRVDDLKSESYIVYTLETILWIILNCNSAAEAIVGAVNLGGDTDTIAAHVGAISGIIYGIEDIPSKWVHAMKNFDYLEGMIRKFEKTIVRWENM
ncbi:MAG: ADP-ribosylglycohydrolase family protein [Bacilli bacterium]|nr:ADP-ribosylglycohydrolase family protein [Bacilli bacterium]